MSTEKHTEIFERGVEYWNQWREEHPDITPDITGIDLRHANLKGIDFSRTNLINADLTGAVLYEANFANANLSNASLHKARLSYLDLSEANLSKANLSEVYCIKTTFEKAILKSANLNKIKIYSADCIDTDLSESDLRDAFLYEVDLSRANLSHANLSQARFTKCTLRGAVLFKAYLRNLKLESGDLSNSNLCKANLFGANLSNANLASAKLTHAVLYKANLQQANLENAELREVNLTEADLREAQFLNSNLKYANLSRSIITGVSSQNIQIQHTIQEDLLIAEENQPDILADHIQVANLLRRGIKDQTNGDFVEHLARSTILVFGHFDQQRGSFLGIIRNTIRQHNALPISINFINARVDTLQDNLLIFSQLSHLLVLDLTDAENVIDPIKDTISDYPKLRIQPILQFPNDHDMDIESPANQINNENQILSLRYYNNESDLQKIVDNILKEQFKYQDEQNESLPEIEDETEREYSELTRAFSVEDDLETAFEEYTEDDEDGIDTFEKESMELKDGEFETDEIATDESYQEIAEAFDHQSSEPAQAPAKKKLNFQKIFAMMALVIIAGLGLWLWNAVHRDLLIIVPGENKTYLFLDDKMVNPTSKQDGKFHYQVDDHLIGKAALTIYPTQLKDINSDQFVRYKRYHQIVEIPRGESSFQLSVHFDTLYSVRYITEGKLPNLNPGGTKILYLNSLDDLSDETRRKELRVYDLVSGEDEQIKIRSNDFYNWKWNRAYFSSDGQNIFMTARRYGSTYPFIVSSATGRIQRLPLKAEDRWTSLVHFNDFKNIMIENKIYNREGIHQRTLKIQMPLYDQIFYSGTNSVLYWSKAYTSGDDMAALSCWHLNLDTLKQRLLFQLDQSRVPFLSGTSDGKRVVVSEYAGKTLEFLTTIKLWEDNKFVKLTNSFVDGDRNYSDGSDFHQTKACINSAGNHIVFEYESKIYLISMADDVTITDFLNADLERNEKIL